VRKLFATMNVSRNWLQTSVRILTFLAYSVTTMPLGIQPDQIGADGWSIGYDQRFPQHSRLQQAFMFARLFEHENLYAHPLVRVCLHRVPSNLI
jgi:hypothetical protein